MKVLYTKLLITEILTVMLETILPFQFIVRSVPPIGKLRNQQGLCLVIMKRSFNRYFNNVVHVGVFLK